MVLGVTRTVETLPQLQSTVDCVTNFFLPFRFMRLFVVCVVGRAGLGRIHRFMRSPSHTSERLAGGSE
jgi:hypothetical protein